jgi:hypothetical protein
VVDFEVESIENDEQKGVDVRCKIESYTSLSCWYLNSESHAGL